MNKILTLSIGLALGGLCAPAQQEATPAATVPAAAKANIQLAILLDTSGSMHGLINQARTQLWKIVNELVLARQNGQAPHIQLALYEYGFSGDTDDYPRFIRRILPFTDDLDAVSEKLFALETSGSVELCGEVIDRSVKELEWNVADKGALKLIFIAGNEEFNQEYRQQAPPRRRFFGKHKKAPQEECEPAGGEPTYRKALRAAGEKGITVNTIYCGDKGDYCAALWKSAAQQAGGTNVCIDHNNSEPDPETPMDKELAELSEKLNATYIAYGSAEAQRYHARKQAAQDRNAFSSGKHVAAARAKSKASKVAYRNSSWDLVDRFDDPEDFSMKEIGGVENLPAELRGKTEAEIRAYIAARAKERAELRKRVMELSQQRDAWIADYRRKAAGEGRKVKTLDDAIIEAVHQQAEAKKFSFETPAATP